MCLTHISCSLVFVPSSVPHLSTGFKERQENQLSSVVEVKVEVVVVVGIVQPKKRGPDLGKIMSDKYLFTKHCLKFEICI